MQASFRTHRPPVTPQTRTPIKDFFKKQLTTIKESPKKMKENAKLVKQAIVLRDEGGETELSAKVKYPAAYVVSVWGSRATVLLTTMLLTSATSWSNTMRGVVGGIGGDFFGSVLSFGAAWYVFNMERFKREGFGTFLKEWGTLIKSGFVGLAINLDKRLDEKEKSGENVSKLKRWTHRVMGTLLSPVPVIYYLYGGAIALATQLGMNPTLAAFAGGFGLPMTFMAYAGWINRKFFSEIDERVAANGVKKETKPNEMA